ncbi:MAG: hypothetical protein WAR57_13745 [Candidatus Phosphoribacter sp.]|nr:hypothetical protein [Actinomycetales bacterium]
MTPALGEGVDQQVVDATDVEGSAPSVLLPAPSPEPPHTGDQRVDDALGALYTSLAGDFDAQIEAADAAGRTLHGRLQDLESS